MNSIKTSKCNNGLELKLEIRKVIFCLILFLPCFNAIDSLFGLDSILYYYCFISILLILNAITNQFMVFVKMLFLVVLLLFNYASFGLYYVTHADFYGCFFLFIVMFFPVEPDRIVAQFNESKLAIKVSTYIYILIIFLSLLLGKGYNYFNSYASYKVLFGPYNLSHTLSYELLFYLIINWVAFKCSFKNIIVLGVLLLCLMFTQVRTAYLALLVVIVYELIVSPVLTKKQKGIVLAVVVGLLITVLILYYRGNLGYIPFLEKTIVSAENGSITNNREEFVEIAINYFKDLNLYDKVFGVSLDGIRALFYKKIGVDIHCHNDFFNILLGYGLVGFISFLLAIFSFIKSNNKLFFCMFLFVFIWFNGLYMYSNFVFLLIIMRAVYFKKTTHY